MKYRPPSGAEPGSYRFIKTVTVDGTRTDVVIRASFRIYPLVGPRS
jgi:hypothetical protein